MAEDHAVIICCMSCITPEESPGPCSDSGAPTFFVLRMGKLACRSRRADSAMRHWMGKLSP
eukprot:9748426-Alexandrium_andersonii.AAC.1